MGDFVVKGLGSGTEMGKAELLINEIGAYDGTVVWNKPKSFFIVNSDGDWSVTW